MIRERFAQRREEKIIEKQADAVASSLAYSEGEAWVFNVGVAPRTTSVMEFAKAVGERSLSILEEKTSMDIARFCTQKTYLENTLHVGVNENNIEQVPPPNKEVYVVFDRTTTGEIYGF